MDRGTWKQPVILEIFGQPGPIIVQGTLDAALMLLSGWPAARTEAHMAAVMACRDVLTGRSVAALARADFIEAALEAGFHVQPQTFLADIDAEPIKDVPASLATLPISPDRLAPLAPFRRRLSKSPRLRGLTLAYTERDADELDSLPSYHHPVISWSEPHSAASGAGPASPHTPCMRELLAELSRTIGMIARLGARRAAGVLRPQLRHGASDLPAAADAHLGNSWAVGRQQPMA